MSKGRNQDYRYIFSFVMPIYNVEAYLEEAIESILSQTLSFESNCQLILVNDGSPDNSEAICLKYKDKYPENIIYIKQENKGVSAARNAGIEIAEGKYISFLDPDDKISSDTIEEVYDFFENHYSEIDVVAIKMNLFDAQSGPHRLNYKFSSDRVVDLRKNHDYVQLSGGSSFIKSEAIGAGNRFDTALSVAEDVKFLNEIILEKMAYGVLSRPVYHYRKRESKDSALSSSRKSKSWYFDVLEHAHSYLIKYSIDKFGYVPRYMQYLIMYDLQTRLMQKQQPALTDEEVDEYKLKLFNILSCIDDDIIVSQKDITSEYKLFALNKKYNQDITKDLQRVGVSYYYKSSEVYNYDWNVNIYLEYLEANGDTLTVEGTVWAMMLPGVELEFTQGVQSVGVEWFSRPSLDKSFLGESVYKAKGFRVQLRLNKGNHITALLKFNDSIKRRVSLSVGRHTRMIDSYGKPYRAIGEYLICQPDKKTLYIDKNTPLTRLRKELIFLKTLINSDRYKNRKSFQPVNTSPLHSPVIFRLAYFMTKPFIRRKIWIISDRVNEAGDNGEAFYKYVKDNGDSRIKPYYLIMQTSPDYKRIRKETSHLTWGSWRYKLLFLHADKVISSHASDFVLNAFEQDQHFVRDLYRFDYIFLQHGIIKDDLSAWLNKYSKNIKLFITSTKDEYNSIVNGDYFYDKERVALTGLPRYDLLHSEPKNKVIIAPTWRKKLVSEEDPITKNRPYKESFKSTEFYSFYNTLMKDAKLLDALKRNNYRVEFYIHPALSGQVRDFSSSGVVTIMKPPYDYGRAFREGSLLVTDFSSVAFDFAYMKKPVIYSQFDADTFYEGHMYEEGYFSYERDGLGPVTYSLESTIDAIIASVNNKCEMEDRYRKRVDNFFAHTDRSNSKRVYDAILALDDKY